MLSFNKTLRTGDTYTFSVSNAGKDKVRWHSSKSSVLTVDSKGKCKAVKHGTASVTAKVNVLVCDSARYRNWSGTMQRFKIVSWGRSGFRLMFLLIRFIRKKT